MTRRRTRRPRRRRRTQRQRQTRKTTLRMERPRPTRWVDLLGNRRRCFGLDRLHDQLAGQGLTPVCLLCLAGGGSPRGGQGGGQVRVAPLPKLPHPSLQSPPNPTPPAREPSPQPASPPPPHPPKSLTWFPSKAYC